MRGFNKNLYLILKVMQDILRNKINILVKHPTCILKHLIGFKTHAISQKKT